ncbi:MAG TPA: hypothetical protein VF950_11085 [Planctomycetota bacterium]
MILAALVLLLQADLERRVLELTEKLSSEAIDAREEAAAALVELGPDAAPILERAAGARDAEGKGRIREILREIARDAVLRGAWRPARRVDAAWKDVPLSQALEAVATATGETFKGGAEIPGAVTLDLRRATLWESLDALCRAAPALTWSLDGEAVVFKAAPRPPFPSVARDELLAWVDVVEYGRDIDFSGAAREWAVVGINLAWTAGLTPLATELRVTEVLDVAGRNLLPNAGFRFSQPPKASATPKARHRREESRMSLLAGARVDRIRGYGQLLFPRGYEEVKAAFGATAPIKAGDAQVALRGGSSTRGACSFQAVITYAGKANAPRLPPTEVMVIDDQGAEHPASLGRGQATSFTGTGWSIHQSYDATLPADRRPVAARLRLPKDVFERKLDFDFAIPSP